MRQRKFFRERKVAVIFLEGKRVESAHVGEGDGPVTGEERAAVFAARRAWRSDQRVPPVISSTGADTACRRKRTTTQPSRLSITSSCRSG